MKMFKMTQLVIEQNALEKFSHLLIESETTEKFLEPFSLVMVSCSSLVYGCEKILSLPVNSHSRHIFHSTAKHIKRTSKAEQSRENIINLIIKIFSREISKLAFRQREAQRNVRTLSMPFNAWASNECGELYLVAADGNSFIVNCEC